MDSEFEEHDGEESSDSELESHDGEESLGANEVIPRYADGKSHISSKSNGLENHLAGLCDENGDDLKDQKTPLPIMARWLYEPDDRDKLSASHFRKIVQCSCGKLEQLLGTNYIEISICGESFMLHQVSPLYTHHCTTITVLSFLYGSCVCVYIYHILCANYSGRNRGICLSSFFFN